MERNAKSIAAALVFVSPLILQAVAAPKPSNPNIILVMPDDVGYGDYAFLGSPIMRTPAV